MDGMSYMIQSLWYVYDSESMVYSTWYMGVSDNQGHQSIREGHMNKATALAGMSEVYDTVHLCINSIGPYCEAKIGGLLLQGLPKK